MSIDRYNYISTKFRNHEIKKLESGASKRLFYRLSKNSKSFIVMDSSNEKKYYYDFLKIHNYLSKINIHIPKILDQEDDKNILILEDLGDQRFDKVLNKYDIYTLLKSAVDSLILINNKEDKTFLQTLEKYNYDTFSLEINELTEYFFPYKKIDSLLISDFNTVWQETFNSFNFEFNAFVHKDFELINLIYLPNCKDHLRCGIIDFQSAFRGFAGWDLFSLLEDSRIYFTRKYNEILIRHYYDNTSQNLNFEIFRQQYYFFNLARHTRLLGRWIKFSIINNNHNYLKYIDSTRKRMSISLKNLNNKPLNNLYNQILVNFND
ncbi:MAG: hypothetical protein CFH18_00659 [Alphaproteobacteria bacterium MarineAlpha5_Bin8]|nr:MAG: hypothetical protein CFH17_00049 [Alphaproteobacteria bacterium MarineAlpha5_Bin7]PPR46312.1 MAG: hypothetical protein CFH18_00659 [Alphaproteobacteria bacterium MarineAlpha5_Bin8]PPR54977.1 MAG: hypothetical protein CFH16_00011 [Alphaproteobacteria bacterium MarineAlpha5_Bin6]|tara:strand:- start:3514 stop:4476 length:963 start_codon:yes stop_codon:yes gene_type:complete